MPDDRVQTSLTGRLVPRRSMLTGAAMGVVAPAVLAVAPAAAAPEIGRGKPDSNPYDDETRQITIYAEELPDGVVGYGLASGEATVPGPILEIWEGATLEVELVDNSVDFDGSPLNDSFNEPEETRTYVWRTRAPFEATGGTWMPREGRLLASPRPRHGHLARTRRGPRRPLRRADRPAQGRHPVRPPVHARRPERSEPGDRQPGPQPR